MSPQVQYRRVLGEGSACEVELVVVDADDPSLGSTLSGVSDTPSSVRPNACLAPAEDSRLDAFKPQQALDSV